MLTIRLVLASGAVREVSIRRGQSYLHVLFEQGLTTGKAICAGVGLCGQCRVRFVENPPPPLPEEAMRLGASAVGDGWRLACRHQVEGPSCLEIPDVACQVTGVAHSGEALAVDIGTTRVKWAVLADGICGPEHSIINPQMGAGSEIMARLRYALSSPAAGANLRSVLVDCIRSIVSETGAQRLAVSGNTTMIAFLLGAPVYGLAMAPYATPLSGGAVFSVSGDLPPAYIPPLLGPFIGADISAGLVYLCALPDVVYPFLLADLGTNGEFVLAVDHKTFVAASVPMGPAIEGVGLCCGAPSGPGVGSRFELTPKGLAWDASPLTAISGTGYFSLLAILRRIGLVDVAGHFTPSSMPLGRRLEAALVEHPLGRILRITDGVFLAERDIEEFLKVKAGVNAAIRALLGVADLSPTAVRKVYLAGALGEHTESAALFALGVLPRIFEDRIAVMGNTSLAGTLKILKDQDARAWLARLPPLVQIVDLVGEPDFASGFVQGMRFEWV